MLDEQTKNLLLKDYDKIWSKFCFLDESGSLNNTQAPFFTVGLIKCSQPYYLYSKLKYQRNKVGFYDEMKFNKLSERNVDFAKYAISAFLDTRSVYFYSYSLDKNGPYFRNTSHANPWVAYEQITIRLLDAALSQNEIIILLADDITVPKDVHFEVNVKRKVNEKAGRLAVAGVCRFNSKGNELLQLVDLFIGAINYDLKMSTGIVGNGDKNKKELVRFIKENVGVSDFISNGFRNRIFNIFVDKDAQQRLPINTVPAINEKRPSS